MSQPYPQQPPPPPPLPQPFQLQPPSPAMGFAIGAVIATASVVFGMAVFSLFEPDLLMLFYMTLPSGSLLLIAVIVLVVLVLRRKRRGLPLHPTIPIVLVAGIGGLPLMALISTLIMFSFSGEMFLAMTVLFTIYAIFLGGGFAVVGSIVVAVIAHNQRKKLQPHPAYYPNLGYHPPPRR
ncbi:MAG: hypothetical protein L0K07_06180 [Yaniella sp.]|uniref:hypothetical protein n=1 Tax=Yaniella sp. TaxID=2773929 RepID=UPI0026476337|nr:hypothetical protein [Yaniella sp.]MDN5705240.1 hypothetical protein [Yaniella sp.]MDN5730688.1 hypothetical protein [Yaniella sp.]MDN5815996.1 hypothetical protein [Yaniella sp.]MDN5818438.1 hypothetical protein [Yaniella sp.]MDN5838704.1 hypothetical protein [Yaniella sp.]